LVDNPSDTLIKFGDITSKTLSSSIEVTPINQVRKIMNMV